MEVQVVALVQEVALLGGVLELLVVVVDNAHAVRLTVRQVARQVRSAGKNQNYMIIDTVKNLQKARKIRCK